MQFFPWVFKALKTVADCLHPITDIDDARKKSTVNMIWGKVWHSTLKYVSAHPNDQDASMLLCSIVKVNYVVKINWVLKGYWLHFDSVFEFS